MSIPGTAVVVGFNSMFADLVSPSWRGYVAGVRNALLSIVSTVTTLVCGWVLVTVRFPTGYQVVFLFGLLGGVMSSLHLYLISRDGCPDRSLRAFHQGMERSSDAGPIKSEIAAAGQGSSLACGWIS